MPPFFSFIHQASCVLLAASIKVIGVQIAYKIDFHVTLSPGVYAQRTRPVSLGLIHSMHDCIYLICLQCS